MALGHPLIAWGSPVDLSAWTDATGTVTVTSSVADPFGGTGAYTYSDNDAGQAEGREVTVTFTRNGTQYVAFFAKQSTATGFMVGIYDTGGAGYRGLVSFTWSGLTSAVTSGSATVFTPISVGSSWYLFRVAIDNIVAANTNKLRLYPTLVTGSLTGATSFYLRNAVLVPVLDNVLRYSRPRAGSEQVQGASGLEDAWTVGTDYYLDGDITHIPDRDQESPDNCSGYDGSNPYTGVNCGFDAMLRAGRDKQSLLWVPDRADCSTYLSSYLAQPMEDPPRLATTNANLRALAISLRQSTRMYEGWV